MVGKWILVRSAVGKTQEESAMGSISVLTAVLSLIQTAEFLLSKKTGHYWRSKSFRKEDANVF